MVMADESYWEAGAVALFEPEPAHEKPDPRDASAEAHEVMLRTTESHAHPRFQWLEYEIVDMPCMCGCPQETCGWYWAAG
jgi:hypothetical protein